MGNTTKRQITIERHSYTRIRISGRSRFVYCEVCRSETLAFTAEQAARYFQTEVDVVLKKIEAGELHLIDSKRTGLICGNSME